MTTQYNDTDVIDSIIVSLLFSFLLWGVVVGTGVALVLFGVLG